MFKFRDEAAFFFQYCDKLSTTNKKAVSLSLSKADDAKVSKKIIYTPQKLFATHLQSHPMYNNFQRHLQQPA